MKTTNGLQTIVRDAMKKKEHHGICGGDAWVYPHISSDAAWDKYCQMSLTYTASHYKARRGMARLAEAERTIRQQVAA